MGNREPDRAAESITAAFHAPSSAMVLTKAVITRPDFTPVKGFRKDTRSNNQNVIRIALPPAEIVDNLCDLMAGLGDRVNITVVSGHEEDPQQRSKKALKRDVLTLRSRLWDFEGWLLNDGYVAVTFQHPEGTESVTLNRDKTITLVAANPERLKMYKDALIADDIPHIDNLQFAGDNFLSYMSNDGYETSCDDFCYLICVSMNPHQSDAEATTLEDYENDDLFGDFRKNDWMKAADDEDDEPDAPDGPNEPRQ